MHEVSLVCALLDIVEDCASRHGFSRVNSLRLSFGVLSGIEPHALKLAFEALSPDTRCRGASLEFEVRPAVAHCLSCGRDHQAEGFPSPCPGCGGFESVPAGGFEDLKIEELDVD